ncbi:MAG TPA: DUF3313 domain-containing protein [Candidatus Binatia bacterium]|nr:DUF3313 domain-containing protein [Candidatus Binatia bacterium]
MPESQKVKWSRRTVVTGMAVLLTMTAGCTATRGRRGTPEESGFLRDYSQLQKNPDYPASLTYIKPGADWSRYSAIQLDSVGLWGGDSIQKLSAEDRQMLTDTLYKSLYDELSKYFNVTTQAGPNTLRLRAALTQAEGANVAIRTVTTVIPQMRVVGTVVGLGADTATTVGSATVEVEVLDPVTNERLAAAVDSRAGTKVLFASRAYSTWGDVKAACDYWSKRISWQFARAGVQRKPGVAMPEEPSESRTI